MDVRRTITIQDVSAACFQATVPDLQPLLKEVVPHRLRTPSELKKFNVKALDVDNNDADALLRNNRNGDWITGFPVTQPEFKSLSFKAVVCAMHSPLFGAFSQKLHAITKGQLESEYRLYQAKQPPPRMLRESKSSVLAAVASAKPAASALQIPFMTDRIRPEVWDPEVANLLQNVAPRPGICVVGPPRSGKTRLAAALAAILGVSYFSIPLVLDIAAKTSPPPPGATEVTPQAELYATIREALLAGRTVSREQAVAALLYHMVESLNGAQGFLVDDLYPHDAWGSDAFLGVRRVAIKLLDQNQWWYHIHGLIGSLHVASISFCPKRRLLYSARDLAQFTGVVGFAHTYVEPGAAALAPSTGVVETPLASDENAEGKELVDDDDEGATKDVKPSADLLRFPRQSLDQFAPHTLPVHQDRVINMGNVWLRTFEAEFTAYERSVAKTMATVPADTQVVRIVFHQSPIGILQQAVGVITGVCVLPTLSRPPLSRLPPSLSAVRVDLPPEVLVTSRGDQIRWLLYGDWSTLIQDGGPLASVKHLVPPSEPRKLSVFRGFCPVNPSHHGQPTFAALFSGRVYLLSSMEALDAFRVSPQQFIERVLSPLNELRLPRLQSQIKRLWLVVATTTLSQSLFSLPRVATAVATDITHSVAKSVVIEPTGVLSAPQNPEITSKLTAGESVPHDVVTKEMLQRLLGQGQDPWVVHGLPVAATTWTSMKDLNILPDAVLVFDPPPSGPDAPPPTSQEKEHRTAVQALLTLIAADNVAVVTIAMDAATTDDDVLVALHRRLDPWYSNRLDADEDGGSTSATPPISALEEAARKQWGETGLFCPVTYSTAPLWRLVPGKPTEYVSYMRQQTYAFAGAAEKSAFDRNPLKYIPQSASTTFRPIVLLLGLSTSGRRTVVSRLVAIEKFNAGGDNEDPDEVDEAVKVQLYGSCLAAEWAAVDGSGSAPYILPGFGYGASRIPSPELLALCVARKWFPFVVVPLQVDAATALQRTMQAWTYTPPSMPSDDADGDDVPNEGPKEKAARLAAEEATAREEETVRVTEIITAELEAVSAALEFFKEQGIRIADAVDANRGQKRVAKDAMSSLLKAGLARQANIFCLPETTALERARTLVAAGYWTIGHHGPHCPVAGPSHRSTDPLDSQLCVAYRGRVYTPSDVAAFTAAPWSFASKPTFPTVPGVAVAVLGGPCSGQTTVAKGLCAKFGAVYISPHSAFQWVYACQRGTTLWAPVKDFKSNCDTVEFDLSLVTDALLLQVLVARIRSFECQQRGWVVDGFPSNMAQWTAWENVGDVLPSSVVWLEGSPYTLLAHAAQVHGATSLALLKRIKTWQAARVALLVAMTQTYGAGFVHCLSVDGNSAWKVVAHAQQVIGHVVDATSKYWQALASHRPAPTFNIRLAQSQVQLHPTIATYCPVGLAVQRAVRGHVLDRELLVEYQSFQYYLGHPDNMASFLANPGKTLAAATAVQPPLARDVGPGTLLCHGHIVALGFQGYCPVTYKDGHGPSDWSSIRKGCPYILAALHQTIYCFVDHAAKQRFLVEPLLYASQQLPAKLPPLVDAAPLNVTIPGRLEQALTRATEEAMVALGAERFKFPFVSAQASAVVYVALFLKSKKKFSNQQHHDSPRQVQALLQNFMDDCRLGQEIKELTAPVGSAVKGVRSMREKGDGSDVQAKNARFDVLSFTDVPTATTPMRLHWFTPTLLLDPANASTKLCSILVFTEIYQVTGPVARFCRQIAAQGFLVASCESYHNFLEPGTVLAYDVPGTDLGNQLKKDKRLSSYDDDATTAITALLAHPNANGRVGVTGMCLGGHLAFRAAMDPRVGAAVCYFGTDIHSETLGAKPREAGEVESLARCSDIRGEILMIFGTKDPHVPRQGRRSIYDGLTEAKVDFTWMELKADHAFIRDESSKGRYDPAVAKICFDALTELFHRRLTLNLIDSAPFNPKDLIC
ncbi:hypothetical protein DYB31_005914 [Aphanomyces astaci]|uniref:Dienelactone hydrolase domain-containing protein n=1 Tax=Aphanomyces astaci TaxID=112090 RepID=A0A397EZU9_APHAT|nr:hypothetical protein DYB31_005914 [Aphanomyces astaci]